MLSTLLLCLEGRREEEEGGSLLYNAFMPIAQVQGRRGSWKEEEGGTSMGGRNHMPWVPCMPLLVLVWRKGGGREED